MSSVRLSEADLLASYKAIFKEPSGTMNYADIVRFIGAEPSQ